MGDYLRWLKSSNLVRNFANIPRDIDLGEGVVIRVDLR